MKIDTPTLAILSRCNTVGQNLYLPPGQLPRKDYEAVNKVIVAMGGKWNRGQKAHVFDGTAAGGLLEDVLATGEITTHQELGFFRTQGAALEMLIDEADLLPGQVVLEPSAGEGDLVQACFAEGVKHIDAVELDPKRANGLRALSTPVGVGYTVTEADFLSVGVIPFYDRVVMNPPFSIPGDRRADLTHVERAVGFLKPGGALAAIMSAGVTFRQDKRTADFLALIAPHRPVWTPLPGGAFTASGTSVGATILTLRRAG